MNSEALFNVINSFFVVSLENPFSSSEDLLNANNLKNLVTEIDENIGKNLKLTYDNSLTYKIINLTEVKTQLLAMLKKISKFSPSDLFNKEIEKLDLSKLANGLQNEVDNFIKLLIISALFSTKKKIFGTRINEKNKSLIAKILCDYTNIKGNSQSENKKPIVPKNIIITPSNNNNESNKGNSPEKANSIKSQKNPVKKELKEYPNDFYNIEKELRDKLDNEIRISMEKDISKKELDEELKQNIKNEVNLKKELENLNMRSQRNNKLIALLQTKEEIAISKLKSVEEEYKNLSLKFEKILELKSKFNANISDNSTKEFELISGAMYKLGCVFWENKSENYNKKSKDTWLEAIRLRKYNENS